MPASRRSLDPAADSDAADARKPRGRKRPATGCRKRRKPVVKPPTSSRSSAYSATSTSCSTCRCATRTRPRSCRSASCFRATSAQTEGVVFDNEIAYRPRRQLLVKIARRRRRRTRAALPQFLRLAGQADGARRAAARARRRARRLLRHWRWCIRPCARSMTDTPLPQALTPVYPSTAGMSQAYLRKAIDDALARASTAGTAAASRSRSAFAAAERARRCSTPCRRCTIRAPDSDETALDGRHASGVDAHQVRGTARAAAVAQARARGAPHARRAAMPRRAAATTRRWSCACCARCRSR